LYEAAIVLDIIFRYWKYRPALEKMGSLAKPPLLGASTVSAFSLKQAIANSRKTAQHPLQSAPQAGRE